MKYPDVRLEATTEDRNVDLIEEGYDLVIRVNPAPDESLVGRAFLHDRLVVVKRARRLPVRLTVRWSQPWSAAAAARPKFGRS